MNINYAQTIDEIIYKAVANCKLHSNNNDFIKLMFS